MIQLLLILLLVLLAIWNLAVGIVVTLLLVALLVWAGGEAQKSPLERQLDSLKRAQKGRRK